jgi:hypothetical protein
MNDDAEQTDKIIHFQVGSINEKKIHFFSFKSTINHKAITNIDSIEECRHILEAHNWNIEVRFERGFEMRKNKPKKKIFFQLAVQSTFNDQFNDQATDTGGNEIQRPMMPDVNPVRNATTTTPPPSPNANSHTLPTINILTQR